MLLNFLSKRIGFNVSGMLKNVYANNFVNSIVLPFGPSIRGHKTSSTASKRFLKTGSGNLKYKHACKKHLNKHKGHSRLKNLSQNGTLTGNWLKKMKLIL